ncbi:lamin tail domain-containing protein [Actinoplanes oblitus]|uniref:Lamin tail domain-containing protein n=1 Tax=Actinoplanes oblitus TaxID=3040509 RepID=A0ABY8W5U9_9ACTN|nr:lamin tail domain-containing protein [Actinoplanes oblitus]WIM93204.1 lamin tail domain-containing protein [Actinoplanes oblitus]
MRRTLGTISAIAVALGGSLFAAAPAEAAPSLRFDYARYDSPGTDNRSNKSLNAEWISLVNTGRTAVSLKGWKIVDRSRTYTFGNVTIAGNGGKVTLHTGKGTDTRTQLYWGSGNYVWNNTGDTATLKTKAGKTHDTCTWKKKTGRTGVAC